MHKIIDISYYDKLYKIPLSKIKKMPFLYYLIDDTEIIKLDVIAGDIFKKSQIEAFEWILNALDDNFAKFKFEYLKLISFLSITDITDYISEQIFNGNFKLRKLLHNYKYLLLDPFIMLHVKFFIMKNNMSFSQINKELSNSLCLNFNEYDKLELFQDITKTLNVLSTSQLKCIKINNIDFILLGNLQKLDNIYIEHISEIIFRNIQDDEQTMIILFTKYNITTYLNIISENYFNNEFLHSYYCSRVICLSFENFKSKSMEYLQYFDKNVIIYEFKDPFVNKKYIIFANTFTSNGKLFLSFQSTLSNEILLNPEYIIDYPMPSKYEIKDSRLHPICKLSELCNKNFYSDSFDNMLITYQNIKSKQELEKVDFIFEEVFYNST